MSRHPLHPGHPMPIRRDVFVRSSMRLGIACWIAAAAFAQEARRPNGSPAVTGLDHIPLAVTDLESAAERFRELGFVLKPGRPHDDGIRNLHAKFPDGTEIELITAPEARDSLTAEYRRHLAAGDGPAFVAFYAPDMNSLAARLDAAGKRYHQDGGLLAFPEADPLRPVFFGGRNHSPTDRPEHFAHPNGAEALIGVWLAGDDPSPERELLAGLGIAASVEEVFAPERQRCAVAHLQEAEVVFLPATRRVVPGRPILGATVRVRSLATAREAISHGTWKMPPTVEHRYGRSVFLPPELTHGIWLELREVR
jgi:catechol 2,3-dioxygenase-like lactoylglutathione lyase family enzyme